MNDKNTNGIGWFITGIFIWPIFMAQRDEARRVLRRLVKMLDRHDCEEGGFEERDINLIAEARTLVEASDG